MKIDDWMSRIYKADLRGNREAEAAEFKDALGEDTALTTAAMLKLKDLDDLIAARGEGACAYSSKYRVYLREALTP